MSYTWQPLPASIPHVLAPASPAPPSPHASTSALDLQAAVDRLAALDAPRRRYGLAHLRRPRLGLPQLISTGVKGTWAVADGSGTSHDGRPPWLPASVDIGDLSVEDNDEEEEDRLPWNEAEAEEWARRRRERRELEGAPVHSSRTPKSDSASSRASTLVASNSQPRKAPTANTSKSGSRKESNESRRSQTLVTTHFSATKSTVANATPQTKRKRPAGSPPPRDELLRSTDHPVPAAGISGRKHDSPDVVATWATRNQRRGDSESRARPRTEAIGAADAREPVGDDEILSERGCTQVALPDPTPSNRPTAPSSNPPNHPAAVFDAGQPFSSPGLRASSEVPKSARASTPTRLANATQPGPRPTSLPAATSSKPGAPVVPVHASAARYGTDESSASEYGSPGGRRRRSIGQLQGDPKRESTTAIDAAAASTAGNSSTGGDSLDREAELQEILGFVQGDLSG